MRDDIADLIAHKDRLQKCAPVCAAGVRGDGDGEVAVKNDDTGEILVAGIAQENIFARDIGRSGAETENAGLVDDSLQVLCCAAEVMIVVFLAGALDECERIGGVLTDIRAPAMEGGEQCQQQKSDAAAGEQQLDGPALVVILRCGCRHCSFLHIRFSPRLGRGRG